MRWDDYKPETNKEMQLYEDLKRALREVARLKRREHTLQLRLDAATRLIDTQREALKDL
jgi:hypothetical protein